MSGFVLNQDWKTLDIIEAGLVWNKDPLLRIKRDVRMPIVQLEQIEAGDEEEEEGEDVNVSTILVAKPRPTKKKTTKPAMKEKV